MYEIKEPFWLFVDHWQTLIAGVLALCAAALTVWATIRSANRQVNAANEAADRQIKAAAAVAKRQVATAQEQTQAIAAAADRQVAAAQEQTRAVAAASADQVAARGQQVTALKDQIEEAQAARHQIDERRLSVIKWAVSIEANRLEAAVSALDDRALPSRPQPAARTRNQLLIESSPLLRGEREEIALLDDQVRTRLEKLASLLDEYNSRIQTARHAPAGDASGLGGLAEYPFIDQDILTLVKRLGEAIREIRSVL
jgi:hypothetical protein